MNEDFEGRPKFEEIRLGNETLQIQHIQAEDTEPGFGYHVEVYAFADGALAERQDLALTWIEPGKFTPPQYVKRDGSITDYAIEGSGRFVCVRPNGEMEVSDYTGGEGASVSYGKGSFIFWQAGAAGFRLAEVCNPPYKLGDLENLKLDGSDSVQIPEEFMKMYNDLTK